MTRRYGGPSHPDPAVRETVRKALLDLCLRSRSWPIRGGADDQGLVRLLALVADESALPVLDGLAATAEDPFTRMSALGAVARLRPAEAVDRVLADAARAGRWVYHPEMLAAHVTEADAGRPRTDRAQTG